MLEELRIQNFAIIDKLELDLAPGFNVITGETGAGKSIIIDAVELLLGGKADGGTVRAGEERALIEGTFILRDTTRALLLPILQREELIADDEIKHGLDSVTLTRELRRNGRSSARVNGTTVSTEILREIGQALVDIHGQSEHLSLLNPRSHLDLLDRYADTLSMREALGQVVLRLEGVRSQVRALMQDKAELQRRAERLRYSVEEITTAELELGEEDQLRDERTRLSNSEQLAKLTGEITVLLSAESDRTGKPALDQLMQIAVILGKLGAIDPSMKEQHDLAESISDQAQELSIAIKRYGQRIEYNPERLDEVEERLELIASLKRRYGGSIEAVLSYAEKARIELEGLENSEERLNELRQSETQLLRHIGELAHRLSAARAIAGRKLAERTVTELTDLRMESTRFEVEMFQEEDNENGCYVLNKRLAFTETGIDRVEFMMSANPGEPLRPLAKVASGGETARIMLALKRVLAQADHTPTLIFDEIDQGIGGRVGAVVGQKLWALAEGHQVLCVTHLAQLAGYGDRHYRVSKSPIAGRTATQVLPLEQENERVEELAAMLGTLNEAGRQSAREILRDAERSKAPRQPEQPTQGKLL